MEHRTKVLDVDVLSFPDSIDLGDYEAALVLVRCGARPIGLVPVRAPGGRLTEEELRERLQGALGWTLWDAVADAWFQPDDRAAESPPATVAICSHERADDLRRCLDGLIPLVGANDEIVVVDSGPKTEATREMVATYPTVRYVREDRPGLSRARNCALETARHDLVAFIDDDAVPDAHWLRCIRRNFEDPLTACVTGLAVPLEIETEAQHVFELHYGFARRGFQRRIFDLAHSDPLAVGRIGAGVNMAVRRSCIEEIGLFDPSLGPGTICQSGDDHEMFARILRAGYRIIYDPEAIVRHRHRRTRKELENVVYGYGVGAYAWFTRCLMAYGEPGVFRLAFGWFRHEQLPRLVRGLLGRQSVPPLDLTARELLGCLIGPWAYFKSRRQLNRIAP